MLIRTLISLALLLPALSQAADAKYYSARPDQRLCPSPVCGGIFIQEVNKVTTRCPDNHLRRECYVAGIDWSELQLTEEQVSAAQSLAASGRAILSGQLREKQFGESGKFGELAVNAVWEPATDAPASGVFYRVSLNGIVCITAPCPSLTAEKLNSNIQNTISELDLTQVGASEQKLNAANEHLATGVLVAGYHKPEMSLISRSKSQTLIASQFYLPFTADSATPTDPTDPTEQCYIGGCSGQVCSDSPDVVTTCEYRPEYACYSTAACERQADGNCGWTPTVELTTCLNKAGQPTSGNGFPFGGFNLQ